MTCDDSNHRELVSDNCTCKPGYFNNGVDLCAACHRSCKTCSGETSSNCLTCETSNNRSFNNQDGTCLCDNGYFDNGSAAACFACHFSCSKCTSNQYLKYFKNINF